MSKYFILDEWIWHDLLGENGQENFYLATKFLYKLFSICDKIVVSKESKFIKKQALFSKNLNKEEDPVKVQLIKFYFNSIYLNSDKYIEINIAQESEVEIPEVNPDDHYLIKTYRASKLNVSIITSDKKLLNILKKHNFDCYLKDEFIKDYLNK